MTQLKKIIFMPLQVYYVDDVKVSWPPNNLLLIDDLKSLFLTNYYKLPDFGREVEMVLGDGDQPSEQMERLSSHQTNYIHQGPSAESWHGRVNVSFSYYDRMSD